MAKSHEDIVWIDCEMTGLDSERDALIEVAVLITDAELNIRDEGLQVVIRPPQEAVENMGSFVRQMHTSSGLLEELDQGITMEEAEEQVLAHIRRYVPERRCAQLGGNSVGTDKVFLSRDMPRVIDHLHYRIVDVSTIKELARRWYPRVYYKAPEKTGNHRALGDIRDSIDELRYYRSALFVPQPGPDSETAGKLAQEITAARSV